MGHPTHAPHPYGHWKWIELWAVDSDDEVEYGRRQHVWAFEVDEDGDDLWVEWSLEEDMSYADYLEEEAFGTWKEEVEEMQYLISCEPSGDAVEVISCMTFSWGD